MFALCSCRTFYILRRNTVVHNITCVLSSVYMLDAGSTTPVSV